METKMETEIGNLIKVWTLAMLSSCYCYKLSRVTQKGVLRLTMVAPIIFLFTILPFSLTTFHLGTVTFFYLTWLSNFKLLLFSFDVGPLPSLHDSLPRFVFTLLLPINPKPHHPTFRHSGGGWVVVGVKLVVLACVIGSYGYRERLPFPLVMGLYCLHLYLGVEITLAIAGAFARASLGVDLSPQFNHPFFTTSLQDFWGNRWNLMVSDVLRLTVYNPMRSFASPLVGRRQAMVVGMLASFLVSGLMHELIYYHATRVSPTWEVTWFFVLHGVCTATEVLVKRVVPSKWQLHRAISGPLTLGFAIVTGAWLFFPQVFRNELHEKAINEYPLMVDFLKRNVMYYTGYGSG